MKLDAYGKTIHVEQLSDGNTKHIIISRPNVYYITVLSDGNHLVQIEGTDISWRDTVADFAKGSEVFIRELGSVTYYVVNGKIILKTRRPDNPNITPHSKLNSAKSINNKFITMDIETVRDKETGVLNPYLLCAVDGSTKKARNISIYKRDGENMNSLVERFVKELGVHFAPIFMTKKGLPTPMLIYAHNLSGFDGILLFKYLVSIADTVKPVYHNGRLMSMTVKYPQKLCLPVMVFRDSYLMLPSALRSLARLFGYILGKGFFPFDFNDIFYKGVIPSYQYWQASGMIYSEYEAIYKEYENKDWCFKTEAIKYCMQDCMALHYVLSKFNHLIFNSFKVDMTKSLTLPSLAKRIYQTMFIPEDSIYKLPRSIEEDIRSSYTGGAVDMYISHNGPAGLDILSAINSSGRTSNFFKRLYYYDVNSLYPFVMADDTFPLPVGIPTIFEGDIHKKHITMNLHNLRSNINTLLYNYNKYSRG